MDPWVYIPVIPYFTLSYFPRHLKKFFFGRFVLQVKMLLPNLWGQHMNLHVSLGVTNTVAMELYKCTGSALNSDNGNLIFISLNGIHL